MRWLVLVGLVACYTPRGSQCEPCSGVEVCPGGLACIAGTCRASASECASVTDGAAPVDARACFGSLEPPFTEICPTIALPAEHVLPQLVDTSTDCTFVELGLCVIAADHVIASTKTRVLGPRPLALLGRIDVRVAAGATLDVAGHATDTAAMIPAGANHNLCSAAHGGDNGAMQFGGGGPGGSFRTRGGAGGAGTVGGNTASGPLVQVLANLRGGCPGGRGGTAGSPVQPGGGGGNGGGALYVLAPEVVVAGTINASGGGGRGNGGVGGGGGGGGSGGMILIWAPTFRIDDNARIFALGGGGGPGVVVTGKQGDDPDGPQAEALPTTSDGSGAGTGAGAGGNGENQGGSGGGGGGGGGSGYIEIRPELASPPANIRPQPAS